MFISNELLSGVGNFSGYDLSRQHYDKQKLEAKQFGCLTFSDLEKLP